jgi:hypothetical protein
VKLGGNWPRYYRYMQTEHPNVDIDAMIDKAFDTTPFITFEYLDKLEENLDTAILELENNPCSR